MILPWYNTLEIFDAITVYFKKKTQKFLADTIKQNNNSYLTTLQMYTDVVLT